MNDIGCDLSEFLKRMIALVLHLKLKTPESTHTGNGRRRKGNHDSTGDSE